MPIETVIDRVKNFNEYKAFFNSFQYDSVFINYTDEKGKEISNYTKEIKPLQKIIQLNDRYPCVDLKNCENCKKMYNTKSIIKPFNQYQIMEILTNKFKCENFKKTKLDFSLERVKKNVKKDLPYIHYNPKIKQFLSEDLSDSLQTTAIIKISEYLDENQLNYEVIDGNKVQIID